MTLSNLGAMLRKARKEQGLTLKQLGARAGLHFTTLSSLERGRVSDLGVRKLLRVAETLGLELVLRKAGQSYTLDDVARERTSATPSARAPAQRDNSPLKADGQSRTQDGQADPRQKLNARAHQFTGEAAKLNALTKQVDQYTKLSDLAQHASQGSGSLLARALKGPTHGPFPSGGDAPARSHKKPK